MGRLVPALGPREEEWFALGARVEAPLTLALEFAGPREAERLFVPLLLLLPPALEELEVGLAAPAVPPLVLLLLRTREADAEA